MKYDYVRISSYWRRHHKRFEIYVKSHGILCLDCKGSGGETIPILDDGTGPWEECGWCEGTGLMTRRAWGFWMAMKRAQKQEEKNR